MTTFSAIVDAWYLLAAPLAVVCTCMWGSGDRRERKRDRDV